MKKRRGKYGSTRQKRMGTDPSSCRTWFHTATLTESGSAVMHYRFASWRNNQMSREAPTLAFGFMIDENHSAGLV